jgi:hypothetical protein
MRDRDSLTKFFDGEFQTSIIAMCSTMRRQPTRTFYEIRRDGTRNHRPWGVLLRTIDEALIAGAPVERVQVLSDLLRDYIIARANARPETAEEAMLADMDAIPDMSRKAA